MRARTADGVELYYEEEGSGSPLLFIHEFAGDHRSWEPQRRRFAGSYRCITYAARGYPPSQVPTDPAAYTQARAVEDAISVLDAAGADLAHVIGLSMGGFATLHLVLRHPERVRSAVIAGVGYGSQPERREQFRKESYAIADAFESQGSAKVAAGYAVGPARVQLQNKNPTAWQEFAGALAQHDPVGAALTMRGVQAGRPSLYELQDELRAISTPVLVVAGDEDEGSLEPSLMLKRVIPSSGLVIMPRTGHTANLEDPDVFNDAVARFLAAVDSGEWRGRDPRAVSGSITGILPPGA
ncbi:MAG: alpha/beta hydrolase [Candidatus Dormibacteraeota bacterium]|nr:alpha/beta hydrolase [Candidatus Dormibacteraeota bacterium]